MGAIIGTVPGWQYDDDYSPDHRTYRAPGYYKILTPKKKVSPEETWEYYIEFSVTIYLCDSKDLLHPLVTRRIGSKDHPIKIREIRETEHAGGLDRWVYNVTIKEAEELLTRSQIETAGLVYCECEQLDGMAYNIKIFVQEVTPPVEVVEVVPPVEVVPTKPTVPTYILGQIELLEERYKEAENTDEKIAIKEEIDRLKERYGTK